MSLYNGLVKAPMVPNPKIVIGYDGNPVDFPAYSDPDGGRIVMYSELAGRQVPTLPPDPYNAKGRKSLRMGGCCLGGLDSPTTSSLVWEDADCSMPTLGGFVVFGAIGALSAKSGRRLAGAMDGVFGSWIFCSVARALNLSPALSALAPLVGAHVAARAYSRT